MVLGDGAASGSGVGGEHDGMPGGVHDTMVLKELLEFKRDYLKEHIHPDDREKLEQASRTVSRHQFIGDFGGAALGALYAHMRGKRVRLMQQAVQSEMARATRFEFADGTVRPIFNGPNNLPPGFRFMLLGARGRMTSVARWIFFPLLGWTVFGVLGRFTGNRASRKSLEEDPAAHRRMETVFLRCHAEVMRRQADMLLKRADALENSMDSSTRDVWADAGEGGGGRIF